MLDSGLGVRYNMMTIWIEYNKYTAQLSKLISPTTEPSEYLYISKYVKSSGRKLSAVASDRNKKKH